MESLARIYHRNKEHSSIPRSHNIVAHNVFWFQGVPFATDKPGKPLPEIMDQLCAMYREIAPTVLCLQEIQSEETAKEISKRLEMNYVYRPGGNLPQYGGAVFSQAPIEEIPLWKDEKPDRVSIGINLRVPGSDPLHIISVHLPSSRQRGAEGGQQQRLLELSKLVGLADVLLGDFNERPGGKCSAYLIEQGYIDTAELCGAGHEPSSIGSWGNRGDQIWVRKAKLDQIIAYFVIPKEKLAIDENGKKSLSDHLPIGCFIAS